MIRTAVVGIGGYGRLLRPNILSAVDHGMCEIVGACDSRLDELTDDQGDRRIYHRRGNGRRAGPSGRGEMPVQRPARRAWLGHGNRGVRPEWLYQLSAAVRLRIAPARAQMVEARIELVGRATCCSQWQSWAASEFREQQVARPTIPRPEVSRALRGCSAALRKPRHRSINQPSRRPRECLL